MGSVSFSILYRYFFFSRGQTAIQLLQRIEDVIGEGFNEIHFYSCLFSTVGKMYLLASLKNKFPVW